MMPTVEFGPLGRRTSRVGLGCGRLVGRDTLRQAAAIVETALDLGIRYFDVAPNYGMGTAEEVLGHVIGDARDVIVATKVGSPRGTYSRRTNLARRYVKPVLDRSRSLKTLARQAYGPPATPPGHRPTRDFSPDSVRRSIDTSLRLLRRSRADVCLAHDPHPTDLTGDLAATFAELARQGTIGAWGVGVDARTPPWRPFGAIWQSGWPEDLAAYLGGPAMVFHGVVRYAARTGIGTLVEPAPELLRRALAVAPDAVVLVSASNAARLTELLSEVR